MSQFLEAVMVVLFGISWPLNIMKSLKSRTAKGKSLPFLIFIWVGYIAGIVSKLVSGNITYVFVFYVLNLIMVSIDFCLYFRNVKLDKEREANQ
ncbi:MAG: hypothetical protein IJD13_00745 [Oscillospiraceae bacterium]|nr:hypothetical protein [Oscillospiraceae bacterium]